MTLSALASEIATDMRREEFSDGVTVTTLREWLGEEPGPIKDALRELLEHRLIHREEARFCIGAARDRAANRTVSEALRRSIERRLGSGERAIDIAGDVALKPRAISRIKQSMLDRERRV